LYWVGDTAHRFNPYFPYQTWNMTNLTVNVLPSERWGMNSIQAQVRLDDAAPPSMKPRT